jgi:aspartokinase
MREAAQYLKEDAQDGICWIALWRDGRGWGFNTFYLDEKADGSVVLDHPEQLEDLQRIIRPDHLTVHDNLALIAVVGRGMIRTPGTAARIFTALANADVNIRMIDQGSSELNIIIAVDSTNYTRAIQAIYNEFAAPVKG